MERIQPSKKHEIKGHILSAWQAIENGVVDQNNKDRKKYWNHWKNFTKLFRYDPFLEQCPSAEKIIIITAFAARVRTGCYGKGNTVRVPTVSKALAAISTTIEMGGQPSPIYKAEKTYKLPVARLMEGFRREDPPSTPQLAIPVSVPNQCFTLAYRTKNNHTRAVGDLAIIAYYYLLRTGEYTKPKVKIVDGKTKRLTRTVVFLVENIGFFKDNKILPRNSNLHQLYAADSCTFKITNQKNGRMGDTINQYNINSQFQHKFTVQPYQSSSKKNSSHSKKWRQHFKSHL